MKEHAAKILDIKRDFPDVSISDIITEYCDDHHQFDMEDFCDFISSTPTLKEFIKQDLIKFNHVTNPMLTWSNLF